MGSSASILKERYSSSQKKDFLRASTFFVTLTDEQLDLLANCFTARHVKSNTVIKYSEKEVMLIGQGEVRVSMLLPNTNRKMDQRLFLCNKRSGDILNPAATKKRAEDPTQVQLAPKLAAMLSDLHMVTVDDVVLLDLKRSTLEAVLANEPNLASTLDPLLGSHLIDHIRGLDFLKGIDEERESQLQLLAEMCRYEAIPEDEVVFSQQDEGNKFYIISHGRCEVRLEKPSRTNRAGSISMIDFVSSPRSKKRNCFGFRADGLDDSDTRRRSSAQRLIERFLCITTSKNGLNGSSSERRLSNSRSNSSKSRGSRQIGRSLLMSTLGPGDYFGETALMLDIPRTSSVVTTERCLFITCNKTYFKNFLLVAPGVKDILAKEMIQRLLGGFKSAKIPFLRMFKEHQLYEVSKLCTLEEYGPSEIICRRNDMASAVYFIVYGQIMLDLPKRELVDEDDEHSNTIVTGTVNVEVCTGNYFGQESLQFGILDTTAISISDCVVLKMASEVEQLLLSAEAVGSWHILTKQTDCSLHDVLSCFAGFEAMRKLLERELSGENLRFLRVVQKFRKMDEQDPGLRPTVLAIVDEFIKCGSPSQVNIEATMRETIIKDSKQKVINKWIFDKCAKEVYNLVERDSFRRFLRSEFFQEVLDQLGVRKDLTDTLPPMQYPLDPSNLPRKGANAIRKPTHTNY